MKKRMIGNLEVSEIGMGCMGFSHGYGKAPSERDSIQAIYKGREDRSVELTDHAVHRICGSYYYGADRR